MKAKTNPHHQTTPLPASWDLEECLKISDVVISAVPSAKFKVPTRALKDGCVCVSVAQEKNFEADVRDRVGFVSVLTEEWCCAVAGIWECRKGSSVAVEVMRSRAMESEWHQITIGHDMSTELMDRLVSTSLRSA